MAQVDQSSRKVVELIQEISSMLHEQAAASQLIAQSVEEITQMSLENVSAAESVNHDASQLTTIIQQLNQGIGFFRSNKNAETRPAMGRAGLFSSPFHQAPIFTPPPCHGLTTAGAGVPTSERHSLKHSSKQPHSPPDWRDKTSDKYWGIGSQRKRWQANLYRGISRILRIFIFPFAT